MSPVEQVENQVREVLAAAFAADPDLLHADSSLRDDVGADSLGMMEVLYVLEQRLGILLPDGDAFLLDVVTVGDLTRAFAARA